MNRKELIGYSATFTKGFATMRESQEVCYLSTVQEKKTLFRKKAEKVPFRFFTAFSDKLPSIFMYSFSAFLCTYFLTEFKANTHFLSRGYVFFFGF